MYGMGLFAHLIAVDPSQHGIHLQLCKQYLSAIALARWKHELPASQLPAASQYPVEDTGVLSNQFTAQSRILLFLRDGYLETDELQASDKAKALVIGVRQFIEVKDKEGDIVVLANVLTKLPVRNTLTRHDALEYSRALSAKGTLV